MAPVVARAQRVELPVREVDLSDGTRRYAVTVQIDGQAQEVGLDTGSTGLRLLPRGLGADARAVRGETIAYAYSSGAQFQGVAVRAAVGVGALARSIRVMRIDRLGCLAAKRDCAAANADPATYGVQGDGLAGQGFVGILGIRLRHDPVDNPFVQLGATRWIVQLPRPGEAAGRIILNPTDAEAAGYQRIGVDENGVSPGCLAATSFGRICAPSFFDTGAPGLRVMGGERVQPWPNGTPAVLALGDGKAMASMDVQIGRRDQASGMLWESAPNRPDRRLSFGLAPYFHWSVLYDADRRQIGLAPR